MEVKMTCCDSKLTRFRLVDGKSIKGSQLYSIIVGLSNLTFFDFHIEKMDLDLFQKLQVFCPKLKVLYVTSSEYSPSVDVQLKFLKVLSTFPVLEEVGCVITTSQSVLN